MSDAQKVKALQKQIEYWQQKVRKQLQKSLMSRKGLHFKN